MVASQQVIGVGVNCVAPSLVLPLYQGVRDALQSRPFFAYPVRVPFCLIELAFIAHICLAARTAGAVGMQSM